jgi:hypothetical protein
VRRLGSIAFVLAFVLGGGGVALAQLDWSVSAPARHRIDTACDAYSTARGIQRYHLTRFATARARDLSGWKASDPQRDDAIMNAPGFVRGEFLTIVARGPNLATTMLSASDSSGDGGIARGYCYVAGSLARATAEVADVSDEMAWTRTRYYAKGQMIADSLVTHDLARKRVHAPPPPPQTALAIPVYATPAQLPYYAAFKAARAGTLPRAR